MKELFTVKEAARMLRFSEGTLRNYLSEGKIGHVKVFGSTRITKQELEKHIKDVVDKRGHQNE